MKVLVSDTLSEVGVKIFEETEGIEVDVKTGLTPEELKEIIGQYDGLAIRSATKVTSEIIDAADNLKVIGRAGIGLDNVDIPAASRRGIVVMNTPEGNTITTMESKMESFLKAGKLDHGAVISAGAGTRFRHWYETSSGHPSKTGSVVSWTVMICVHVATLPQSSSA